MAQFRLPLDVAAPVAFRPIAMEERSSTLWPDGPFLPLRGSDPSGKTFVCGHCKKFVLATDVGNGQLWDVDFRCHACGGFSRSPSLPEGQPLPKGTVALLHGDFRTSVTVEMPGKIVTAGVAAVEARSRISGWGGAASRTEAPPTVLDLEHASDYLARLKVVLGPLYSEQLELGRRLNRAKRPTHGTSRLAYLIERAEESVAALRTGTGFAYFDAFVEVIAVLELLERWGRDPAFPRVLRGFAEPHEYHHSLVLLIAVSQLTDLGNGVGLYGVHRRGEKVADFWVQVSAEDRLNGEVKAPEELSRPEGPLTRTEAKSALEKGRKKSLKGRSPQLPPPNPCVLLVGGSSLTEEDISLLAEVTRERLGSSGGRYSHLAGIVLLSFSLFRRETMADGDRAAPAVPSFVAGAKVRWIRNPEYAGELQIVSNEDAGPPRGASR
jgi:hypothetical protein